MRRALGLALVIVLAGCRGIPINVATPTPLTVDINMRIDIVQREAQRSQDAGAASGVPDGAAAAPAADAPTEAVEEHRRDHMAQIQTLKNSRLVGEDRTGRLHVIRLPSGPYGKQVEEVVAAENADRAALMQAEARTRRVPLATVEAEQAAQWRERAFPGEWIEVQDGTGWRWIQKPAGGAAPRLGVEPPA